MTWSSPIGRRYDSPTPFDAPAEPVRGLPASTVPPGWASDGSDSTDGAEGTDGWNPDDTDGWHPVDDDPDGQHLRISVHDDHCLARGAAPT